MDLEEVARMVKRIECPLCGARDFNFKLRCERGERCLTTVVCMRCRHEFEAEDLQRSTASPGPA